MALQGTKRRAWQPPAAAEEEPLVWVALALRGFRDASKEGMYLLCGERVNGQVAYRLVQEDSEPATWLCYAAEGGQWWVQEEGQKGSAQGAYCTAGEGGHPWDEGVQWLEMDTAGQQSAVEVRRHDEPCTHEPPAHTHTTVSGGQ